MNKQSFLKGYYKRAEKYGLTAKQADSLLASPYSEGLPGIVGNAAGGLAASAMAATLPIIHSKFPQVTQEQIDTLRKNLNVPNVPINLSNEKFPLYNFPKHNAFFNPDSNSIDTLSSTMNTAPIIAHEIGHANIHNNLQEGHPIKVMQDALSGGAAGQIINGAGKHLNKALLKNETNPAHGAIKGGIISGVTNISNILPEFEATRKGIGALHDSETPTMEKVKNYASVAPGFGSYLGKHVADGAVTGALSAKRNQLKAQPNTTAPASVVPAANP